MIPITRAAARRLASFGISDQDQKSADLPCVTNHKYETPQSTGARAFTMPLVIGSSIKSQVVVRSCRSVAFNGVDGGRSRSC
jgi:hypothetical protein